MRVAGRHGITERLRIMDRDFLKVMGQYVSRPCRGVLMAVSGGVDSMVMATLFATHASFPLAVAHMNFCLRGKDSEGDQAFVRAWAEARQLPFHTKIVDTLGYARAHGISVEMAARELRYAWFEALRLQLDFDLIALAHQADDQAETLLLNLTRGSGLRGLCGMAVLSGHLFRPLLGQTRRRVIDYARGRKLTWREDLTNADTLYRRNAIRHNVLPALSALNPSAVLSFADTANRLREVQGYLDAQKPAVMRDCVSGGGEGPVKAVGRVHAFKATGAAAYWLFEWLSPMGFTSSQVRDLAAVMEGQSGKYFDAPGWRLWVDRGQLVLEQRSLSEVLGSGSPEALHEAEGENGVLNVRYFDRTPDFEIPKDPFRVCLDADGLSGPFTLRLWRPGDRFRPLGMKGYKKVSDFLVDCKISVLKKARVAVVCSGTEICWVVGLRPDDRFRITPATRSICQLTVTSGQLPDKD